MLTTSELIKDLLNRCDRTLSDPATNHVYIMNEAMGTDISKDFVRGAIFATQVFRKQLLVLQES